MQDTEIIPQTLIESKILIIRDKKVMLDRDLAMLYSVETREINQAVLRNIKRFPEDFMFQLTKEEMDNWKSQIVISNKEKMGLRKRPFKVVFDAIKRLIEPSQKDKKRIGF
ncbi:MAG: ORF6N domain-containing protein [Nitrospirae bacterium]|nr:ORF6N domain-containing protein [Nitrospirota bacterium]